MIQHCKQRCLGDMGGGGGDLLFDFLVGGGLLFDFLGGGGGDLSGGGTIYLGWGDSEDTMDKLLRAL